VWHMTESGNDIAAEITKSLGLKWSKYILVYSKTNQTSIGLRN
jgi:hypothetical protein